MTAPDRVRFVWQSVAANRLRSFLTVLGVVIGIASVILLTSLGEGVRGYVLSEFSQFGSNLLQVNPGRVSTHGIPGVASTIRKLTIEDAEALRRVPGVEKVIPVSFGMARVEAAGRGRSVFLYGVTSDVPDVWKFEVGQGRFLPEGDPRRCAPLAVLGPTLKRELFGDANALGEPVRIAGRRFQVVGVMAPKGQMLGFDIDDAAYVPVASAPAGRSVRRGGAGVPAAFDPGSPAGVEYLQHGCPWLAVLLSHDVEARPDHILDPRPAPTESPASAAES